MKPRRQRPKKHELLLSSAQRAKLERMVRQSRSARSLAFRARIVLECAVGSSNAAVVGKSRTTGSPLAFGAAFSSSKGLLGLGMNRVPERCAKSATRRSSSGAANTEEDSEGNNALVRRTLVARTGLSHSKISLIWRAFELKPHRKESFQLSMDSLLVDKVRDLVGLCLDQPNHAPVLSVDVKSRIQALSRTQPAVPVWAG